MEKVVRSLAEFEEVAREMTRLWKPRAEGATLVTLSGELGAGKTAFTKAVAQELGVQGVVNSPTFVIEKSYALPPEKGKGFARLIHLDAYRLTSGTDLAPLHFADQLADSQNLMLLEWPEQVEGALPTPALHLTITVVADDARKISYEEA